jgi:cytidine deaminase
MVHRRNKPRVSVPAVSAASARELVRAARRARRAAYAPYSSFTVGAAVLTDAGHLVTGCNIENASYGLSMCAERVAIHRAVAEGHRRIRAVAVSAGPQGKPPIDETPCGACRQVLAEFGVAVVILDDPTGAPYEVALDELLPRAFGSKSIRRRRFLDGSRKRRL